MVNSNGLGSERDGGRNGGDEHGLALIGCRANETSVSVGSHSLVSNEGSERIVVDILRSSSLVDLSLDRGKERSEGVEIGSLRLLDSEHLLDGVVEGSGVGLRDLVELGSNGVLINTDISSSPSVALLRVREISSVEEGHSKGVDVRFVGIMLGLGVLSGDGLHKNGGEEGLALSAHGSLESSSSSAEENVVSDLSLTFVVDENGGGSDVSVDDVLGLEVLETSSSGVNDVPELRLRELFQLARLGLSSRLVGGGLSSFGWLDGGLSGGLSKAGSLSDFALEVDVKEVSIEVDLIELSTHLRLVDDVVAIDSEDILVVNGLSSLDLSDVGVSFALVLADLCLLEN